MATDKRKDYSGERYIGNIEPHIVEDSNSSYSQRTVANARWSDITLAIAVNLQSQGEIETAEAAGDKLISFQLPEDSSLLEDDAFISGAVSGIVTALKAHPRFESLNAKGIRLNIAGNRLSVLARHGITQAAADAFVLAVIRHMLGEGIFIDEIRSGGQSGIDEAGIHAAQRCARSCSILCPKGYRFSLADGSEISGRDLFVSRFIEPESKEEKYEKLIKTIRALLEGEADTISRMANAAAAIHRTFGFWWTGFYRVIGDQLVLGPFQGPVACSRIAYGRGVCGSAWKAERTIIVPDVEKFPGHIACSSESRSEIVVPVWKDGAVVAVLDIDSEYPGTFDDADRAHLERIAALGF